MKIKIKMKTPHALHSAVCDIADEDKREETREKLSKWFKYGEYVTIEFDTEKDTATVIER